MTEHEEAFIRWKENTRREALEKELSRLKKEVIENKHAKRKIIYLLIVVSTLFVFSVLFILYQQRFSSTDNDEYPRETFSENESSSLHKATPDSASKIKHLIILTSTSDTIRFKLPDDGIIFSVQIGAYINLDMNKFKQNMISLRQINYGTINQFTLGIFSTYEEAVEFRNIVKKLGFKEAYITATQHGKRINIREALQQRNLQ